MILALVALTLTAQPLDLSVWRKLDQDGRACASCHSPDGIELAAFRFTDKDVLRRAAKHLPEIDQQAILLQLVQSRKAFVKPVTFDPMADRKSVV